MKHFFLLSVFFSQSVVLGGQAFRLVQHFFELEVLLGGHYLGEKVGVFRLRAYFFLWVEYNQGLRVVTLIYASHVFVLKDLVVIRVILNVGESL